VPCIERDRPLRTASRLRIFQVTTRSTSAASSASITIIPGLWLWPCRCSHLRTLRCRRDRPAHLSRVTWSPQAVPTRRVPRNRRPVRRQSKRDVEPVDLRPLPGSLHQGVDRDLKRLAAHRVLRCIVIVSSRRIGERPARSRSTSSSWLQSGSDCFGYSGCQFVELIG